MQHWPYGFLRLRQISTGTDNVKICKSLDAGSEQITVCPDAAGQLPQNPFYFLFFFGHIFFDIIIQVDNSHRLNKQGCSTAGLVVNDARKIEFIFLFDRNDISVSAHSYQRVLEIFLIIGIVQDFFQLFTHTVFRYLNASP